MKEIFEMEWREMNLKENEFRFLNVLK